jgi:trans-aconitate 2-methyltransferase
VSEREWDATAYDRVADPQARWGAAVVDRLPLSGGETVLDAGCGSGRVTEMLLDRVPDGHVIGLDASAAMVDAATRRLAAAGDRVSFVCCDLLDLTPEVLGGRAPVDAVLSTATFHWVTDHDELFRRLAAVLRPGGQLVAQCGGAGNISTLVATVASLGVPRVGEWTYADADTTSRRLDAAGFDVDAVWLHDEPTAFEPGRPFEDFLETVCLRQHLATLPEAQRRAFVEAVATAMPAAELDYVRLNIVARRR